MKFHLPKKLLVAVLAAMSMQVAYAKMVTPKYILDVAPSTSPFVITEETEGIYAAANSSDTLIYSPLVKDGEGKAVITSSLNMTVPIYVR